MLEKTKSTTQAFEKGVKKIEETSATKSLTNTEKNFNEAAKALDRNQIGPKIFSKLITK